MSERLPKLLLEDILNSAEKIITYTKSLTYEGFIEDSKTIDAVVRNFEIIGEAASKISPDFKNSYPNIEWGLMKDMRNKLIHDYFGISSATIYLTIHKDLPTLKEKIEKLL